jgi:hypothetical protein
MNATFDATSNLKPGPGEYERHREFKSPSLQGDIMTAEHLRRAMFKAGGVSPTAQATFHILLGFSDETGADCWPSHASIAERLGRSKGVVRRALRELRAAGWIEWIHRWTRKNGVTQHGANVYRFLTPDNAIAHFRAAADAARAAAKAKRVEGKKRSDAARGGGGSRAGSGGGSAPVVERVQPRYGGKSVEEREAAVAAAALPQDDGGGGLSVAEAIRAARSALRLE